MYSSIEELPTQVKNSFSKEDQAYWMDAYNSKADEGAEIARRYAWEQCRERPSSFSFSAYASVDDWDIQGERIDISSLMKTMDRYIESGSPVSWNHGNYTVGNIWGYEHIKKDGMDGVKIYGNLFGGDNGVYDEVRQKFVRGARGFSVAGESGGSRYECNQKACGRVLKPSEILEIALTPKPANPHATTIDFHEAKGFAKSDDGAIRFTDFQVHQSERECPILKLRKALRDKGIDAHARDNGVFVPFTKSEYELRSLGLTGETVEGGMILRERDEVIKSLYSEGLEKGSLSPDGRFSNTDFQFFCKASEMGLVERRNGCYVLIDPLEAFEKAAKWKRYGAAAREARDQAAGPRRYLRLHTSILRPGQEISTLDPNKVNLSTSEVHRGQPKGVPFAGYYREDQKMPTTFIDKYNKMDIFNDNPGNYKGETFILHPKARRLYINDYNQLRDLFGKYNTVMPDDEQRVSAWKNTSEKKPVLDYNALSKDYDAIEWGPKMRHLSYMHQARSRGKTYDPKKMMELERDGLEKEGTYPRVPISDEELAIGNELAERYNLPNENIDELMILNGKIGDESIFQDVQPYDMSERRVKTSSELQNNSTQNQEV